MKPNKKEIKNLHGRLASVGGYVGHINSTFSYRSDDPDDKPHYQICNITSCRDVYVGEEIQLLEEE
jgi:hypothetical protein